MIRSLLLQAAGIAAAVVQLSCSSPSTPTPPGQAPATLAISCPSAVAAQSLDGNPVNVSFEPTASGGTAPLTTTCTPAAGAFPVGTSSITCTVRDARQQTASCSFPVAVTKVPRVSTTSFLAFGDSITAGVFADCAGLAPSNIVRFAGAGRFQELHDPSRSYPTKLRDMLASRYRGQTITVQNEGFGGEFVDAAGTPQRLSTALRTRPGVLLLQEGANDINSDYSAIRISSALRELIKLGRAAGAEVYVGTLLPQRGTDVGSCRSKGWNPGKIGEVNVAIRDVAAREGAVLVDLNVAFGGVPDPFIGPDGLHPNDAGYEKIAQTFFDMIRQRLEN